MNRRLAFSDIHGNYELLDAILNYYDPDDQLFFLGDAIDRGSDGIKCLQRLLNDKRVSFLLGNHEDTFIQAYSEWLKFNSLTEYSDFFPEQYYLQMSNGGEPTWRFFKQLTKEEQIKIISKLKTLSLSVKITNSNKKDLFLCHSGCDLAKTKKKSSYLKKEYIANREHISHQWNRKQSNIYIVHGHTPVITNYFNNSTPQVIQYADNHKICLDMGTFKIGICAVLDLDSIGAELKVDYFSNNLTK